MVIHTWFTTNGAYTSPLTTLVPGTPPVTGMNIRTDNCLLIAGLYAIASTD